MNEPENNIPDLVIWAVVALGVVFAIWFVVGFPAFLI